MIDCLSRNKIAKRALVFSSPGEVKNDRHNIYKSRPNGVNSRYIFQSFISPSSHNA